MIRLEFDVAFVGNDLEARQDCVCASEDEAK